MSPNPSTPGGHARRIAAQQDVPIGERIRAFRKAAGRTLQDVSAASGISRAALSKIERGEGSPTYDSLLKLARGLGTDLVTLLGGPAPGVRGVEVTRAGEGAVYQERGFTHRLLVHDQPDRRLLSFITEIPAIPLEDYGPLDSHDSEDFLYVLEGVVAVHMEGHDPVQLHEGDSMQMDGRIRHAMIAVPAKGRRKERAAARLLWVSVPLARASARSRP